MKSESLTDFPLVSIIIPCYNHGRYLEDALNSISRQSYPAIEIIVVDDGSTDNTKEIAKIRPEVTYIYQKNQGLSAGRNTGIAHSQGEFFIFLDADDWLLPDAVQTNVFYLQQDIRLAFVSGAHEKFFVDQGKSLEEKWEVTSNHYLHLLQGNYIGMHGAVMYRRFVFDEFLFDISLNACEDYDLYLNIARRYPVLHHTQKIAAYRIHKDNMSRNIPLMLTTVLDVLKRQYVHLNHNEEKTHYRRGLKIWKDYYCQQLFQTLMKTPAFASADDLVTLFKYQPSLGLIYFYKKISIISRPT